MEPFYHFQCGRGVCCLKVRRQHQLVVFHVVRNQRHLDSVCVNPEGHECQDGRQHGHEVCPGYILLQHSKVVVCYVLYGIHHVCQLLYVVHVLVIVGQRYVQQGGHRSVSMCIHHAPILDRHIALECRHRDHPLANAVYQVEALGASGRVEHINVDRVKDLTVHRLPVDCNVMHQQRVLIHVVEDVEAAHPGQHSLRDVFAGYHVCKHIYGHVVNVLRTGKIRQRLSGPCAHRLLQ
ncbi:ORF069R [Largemouth bass ulcerative syndrome virus]|nr:ORF069R [Largemouth bass ulcerative syndrome virus]